MHTTTFALPSFDVAREIDEQRAQAARDSLDASDVLAEVQTLLLEIVDDDQHPLWPLVRHCTEVGTARETGCIPHVAEFVGAALLPLIDRAISRLVTEQLLRDD